MEAKTTIDERRVKSTIIRRRKKDAEPEPVPEVAPQALPVVDLKAKVVASPSTAPAPVPAAHPSPKPVVPVLTPEEIEEAEKKAKLKKPQAKKASKQGVEVEGIGHVSTITQLTRIAHVERVFEPGKSGPGSGLRRRKVVSKKGQHKTTLTVSKQIKRVVEMDKGISVSDLSHAIGVKSSEIIRKLMGMGMMATLNQVLDFDTATLVAQDYQFEVKSVAYNEKKVFEDLSVGVTKNLVPRPPVVTVMGHVDHGKTSLLDAIRQTNVTEGEAGGITQHIGAYTVALPKGKVTFLDTPGHEAFTSMRARGASVTDLVVLVVAADDGVMPQTIESIDHAKAAGVPIVVAVNKIDKPEADVERIKRQLADRGLSPEEWGGETLYTLVSAKKKQGIEELLATILLQAEILELKADPTLRPLGSVVEARLDKSRGPVATVLVREGTLKTGDILVAGSYSGKVRAMTDHTGKPVKEAPPSTAVEITGLDGVPMASDPFHAVPDEQTAAMIVENRRAEKRQAGLTPTLKVSLEDFFAQSKEAKALELNIILKADMQGSLEAVTGSLLKIETEKVKIRVIHSAVGGITESDVILASASSA
ncbi:MAG: translation initiation factor IF-2, partial [Deltaproteobacteria bacterium]|nr:translation initiation factor IF-2 [Deltaproteobacteria bacterium]